MKTSPEVNPGTSPAAGLVILLSAIASIVAVALDRMASGNDPLSILRSLVQIGPWHAGVHVVAMACIGGLMFGHTVLSRRLGLHRAPVQAGLIAYGFGSLLMLIATIIDGFISTDAAALFVGKSPEAVQAGYWMIQVLENVGLTDIARVAWVCQSVAAIAWSCALLGERGLAHKLGMAGLASGALPAIAVFVAGAHMTEAVVVGILLVQAAWNLVAAVYLLAAAKRQVVEAAPARFAAGSQPAR